MSLLLPSRLKMTTYLLPETRHEPCDHDTALREGCARKHAL